MAKIGDYRRYFRLLAGLARPRRALMAASVFTVVLALIFTIILPYLNQRWQANAYAVSAADSQVIAKPNSAMAADLQLDSQKQAYSFNAKFSPAADESQTKMEFGGAKVQATLAQDPSKGVTVTDPYNQVSLTLTPDFQALAARQNQNQIVYPILLGNGALVYTAEAGGVKEDILLRHAVSDKLSFTYKLGLGSQFAAKLQADGSVGIYGSSLPLSNVNTSTAKDAALLAKARAKAPKDKLLFSLPAPVMHQASGHQNRATASFSLKGANLTVTATGLKKAAYPLSIDPSISVQSVTDFFRDTNIDTNADFDGTNNQIKRGPVNGANINAWATTTASSGSASLSQSRFLAGTTIYNGYAYVVGGAAAGTTSNYTGASYVEYAQVSPTTGGTWNVGWANANSSGLPAGGLSRFKLIAYNGYLYAVDGSVTNTSCGTDSNTIYYATIQVNGILTNWSSASGPATALCGMGATAYNGYMYIAGGRTGSANNTGVTTVSYAPILPNGTFGTWNTTTALPSATYDGDLQAYNNNLYFVGGNQNGTLTTSTYYAPLATTGAIYTVSWTTGPSFTTARENLGGNFAAVQDGYLYLAGGCSTINVNQSCTVIIADTQLAQINADGSLGQWRSNNGGSALPADVGGGLVSWDTTLYDVTGCSTMNTTAVQCTTALATQQFAAVTSVGQVSSITTSGNNLPSTLYAPGSAVANGYLYIIGGCLTAGCGTGSGDTANAMWFSKINSDGSIGAWSTSAWTFNGTTGIAATSVVAINNVLYALGGYTAASGGVSTIWTASINAATGDVTANWAANTRTLSAAAYALSSLYYNGNIYVFGGCTSAANVFGCTTYSQLVAKASVSGTTIGAFSSTSLAQLPSGGSNANMPNAASALAYYDGYVYLCGGGNSVNANGSKCGYAQLNSNSTITGWSVSSASLGTAVQFAGASATNGYVYVYGGANVGALSTTFIGTVSFGQINTSTGDIASFSTSPTSITARYGLAGLFQNGIIYAIAGCAANGFLSTCSTRSSATQYFQVYNASNLGTANINSGNTLPAAIMAGATAIYNGYIYYVGGCSSYTASSVSCHNGSFSVSTVYYAPLNPDGSIGTWVTSANALPAGRAFPSLDAINGFLYVMGGGANGNSAQTTVYKSTIGAAGAPGAFSTTNQTALPTGHYAGASVVYNGVIYYSGGFNGSAADTEVYYSTINGSGDITAWTSFSTGFTGGRYFHNEAILGGYLFVMGGWNGSAALSDVQSIKLSPSGGASGSWQYTSDLPVQMFGMAKAEANGYIYLNGGATGTSTTSCLSTSFVAAVNSNGTLGPWSQGAASTTFTALLGMRGGYYNGYYYALGGYNCSSAVAVNNTYYGGEQSPAIKAIFSRYIDLAGNGLPGKLLATGTNAQLSSTDIEKWRFRYSSALNNGGTPAWGNQSTINPLPFASLQGPLTALDDSGNNQGVSQWWFFIFDIDQATTFTFTDANQPTITSYQWYYSPGTTARLRNGQQFQDQIHQSLDAHP